MLLNKIIKIVLPPDKWKATVIILLGVFIGLGFFILKVSKATSYLSDDPQTCVNCHIMAPEYATWNHSSHRQWASCNDCHVPHNNVFNKYYFKAKDGLRHATIFTLRKEPQVIFIKEEGEEVVHNNCLRCHSNLLEIDQKLVVNNFSHDRSKRKCWECHREVPHGRVNSLSSTPNARVPVPESPVPVWLKEKMSDRK
ncbi:MAG: cytochrome c nitrite reductase small subunit [Salinivirgaceae bacterium]|nr:cytochrome c nitrite reductase small subunit [Salinivirgaceae bacterium]